MKISEEDFIRILDAGVHELNSFSSKLVSSKDRVTGFSKERNGGYSLQFEKKKEKEN